MQNVRRFGKGDMAAFRFTELFVKASDYDALAAELAAEQESNTLLNNLHTLDQARIRELEAALTKFLVWNGTDYADDESREYTLIGICEEAYQLIPSSAAETEVAK